MNLVLMSSFSLNNGKIYFLLLRLNSLPWKFSHYWQNR